MVVGTHSMLLDNRHEQPDILCSAITSHADFIAHTPKASSCRFCMLCITALSHKEPDMEEVSHHL